MLWKLLLGRLLMLLLGDGRNKGRGKPADAILIRPANPSVLFRLKIHVNLSSGWKRKLLLLRIAGECVLDSYNTRHSLWFE